MSPLDVRVGRVEKAFRRCSASSHQASAAGSIEQVRALQVRLQADDAARGEVVALAEYDGKFHAAVAAGASRNRVLWRHLLPNLRGTLRAMSILLLARAIHAEAALSFLGFGVRPPGASWGSLLADARHYVVLAPWLALAALRFHGYRSDSRYLVFQCLQHTLDLPAEQWRVLDQAHRKRNLAEYEGEMDVDEQLVAALLRVTREVAARVNDLVAP